MELQIERLGKVGITVEQEYWSNLKTYDKLTIVQVEGSASTYISRIPVPPHTYLNNRKYWIPLTKNNDALFDEIIRYVDEHYISIVQFNQFCIDNGFQPIGSFSVTLPTQTNFTLSNLNTAITRGSSYQNTVTANAHYSISSVTVQMAGVDVTSEVYDSSTGTISISNVTGNIVIQVQTQGEQFLVELATDGHGIWKIAGTDTYTEGGTYTYGSGAVVYHFENYTNYAFDHFANNILPQGVSWNTETKNLTIENIVQPVSITAYTVYIPNTYYINKGSAFSNLDLYKDDTKITGNNISFSENESFQIKVCIPANYHITTDGAPSVTIGTNTTSMNYDNSNPNAPFYYYNVSNLNSDIYVNGIARKDPKLTISGNAFNGDFVATVNGSSKGHNDYLKVGSNISITFTLQSGYTIQDRHFISNYPTVEFNVTGRVYSAEFIVGEADVNFVLEATEIIYPAYWGTVARSKDINNINPVSDGTAFTTTSIQTTEINENGFFVAYPADKSFPTITGTTIPQTFERNGTGASETTIQIGDDNKTYVVWVFRATLPNATIGDRINISFNV